MGQGKKGSGKCTGTEREKEGGEQGPQGGGKREKLCNIMQLKGAKRRELTKNRTGTRKKLYEKGNVIAPCLTPPLPLSHKIIYPSPKTIRLQGRVIFREALPTITLRKLGPVVQNF